MSILDYNGGDYGRLIGVSLRWFLNGIYEQLPDAKLVYSEDMNGWKCF